MIVPPTSFAAEQPDMVAALEENAKGLTSHLDIYLTLRELMAMGSREPLAERPEGESLDCCNLIVFILFPVTI